MKPAPVGINDNLAIDVAAGCSAFAGATLPCHLGMRLGLLFSNDPARCARSAKGQDGCGSRCGKHSEEEVLLREDGFSG